MLLDKELSAWEKYMGVPHTSITSLSGVPKGDGMNGTPLGLNNDPLNVFTLEQAEGELILHVSGEIYGGLTTLAEYENYHLKLQFKRGEAKYEPRLDKQRDNGLLYHCNGPHGAFWNVWMQMQEFQIQEKDMGDYFGLAGAGNHIHATRGEDDFFIYDPNAPLVQLGSSIPIKNSYRCRRQFNSESPHGEWNTIELVCLDGKSFHIVNSKVVMVLNQAEAQSEDGFKLITKGKIQLQSEAAEAFYRRIEITEISELPDFLK